MTRMGLLLGTEARTAEASLNMKIVSWPLGQLLPWSGCNRPIVPRATSRPDW